MTNTLFVLAAIAATTCAQMGGQAPIDPSMLVQRDGCFWDCQINTFLNDAYGSIGNDEICWDTCTPKLSRYKTNDGTVSAGILYRSQFWQSGFERWVFDYALENEEQRTFDFLADFHNGAFANGQCWPWWQCIWSECTNAEADGSEDECWKQMCYEDCGTGEEICNFWYAREYDYEWNQYRWDIVDCYADEGLAGDAMGTVDFVEDNFGGSIGMISEKVSESCANGDCGMMAANVVANVLGDNAARDVAGVLDMFYNNDSAVDIANEIANDGGDTFDVNVDALDFVINAQNSTNATEQAGQSDVLEGNERWADWISSFVSGLMNRADERKGEREENMEWDATNDDYNGNW